MWSTKGACELNTTEHTRASTYKWLWGPPNPRPRRPHLSFSTAKCNPFLNFSFGNCSQGPVTVGSANTKCCYLSLLWISQLCWRCWGHKHDLSVPNDRHRLSYSTVSWMAEQSGQSSFWGWIWFLLTAWLLEARWGQQGVLTPATLAKKQEFSSGGWDLPFNELLVGEQGVKIICMPQLAHSIVGSQNDIMPVEWVGGSGKQPQKVNSRMFWVCGNVCGISPKMSSIWPWYQTPYLAGTQRYGTHAYSNHFGDAGTHQNRQSSRTWLDFRGSTLPHQHFTIRHLK